MHPSTAQGECRVLGDRTVTRLGCVLVDMASTTCVFSASKNHGTECGTWVFRRPAQNVLCSFCKDVVPWSTLLRVLVLHGASYLPYSVV